MENFGIDRKVIRCQCDNYIKKRIPRFHKRIEEWFI